MKACICDLTGEVAKGESGSQLVIELSPNRKLLVGLQTRENDKAGFVQGDIGPRAAEAIAAAVKDVVAKIAKS